MAHFNPSSLISEEEMNRRLGITEDELADFLSFALLGYGSSISFVVQNLL